MFNAKGSHKYWKGWTCNTKNKLEEIFLYFFKFDIFLKSITEIFVGRNIWCRCIMEALKSYSKKKMLEKKIKNLKINSTEICILIFLRERFIEHVFNIFNKWTSFEDKWRLLNLVFVNLMTIVWYVVNLLGSFPT